MSSETVSDERLAYMLDRQNAGFTSLTSAEFISILTELQSLRSKPVAKPYAFEFGKSNGDGTYCVVIERGDEGYVERFAVKDWPIKPLYASPQLQPKAVTEGWQTMDTAPLDGKHCILAVKEPSGFVYSVQGAFQSGQWNAVHRDNVDPIFWKPNIRLPEGWENAKPFSAMKEA